MRTLLLGLLVVSFVSASTVAHADPLDPKILQLKSEARKGKVLVGTGSAALALSLGMGIACGILVTDYYASGISGHPLPAEDDQRTMAAMIATCTLHGALLAVGIPLTIAGAQKIKKARIQLRFGATGLSGTF